MRHSPIVLHDSFVTPGGPERLAQSLAAMTGAVLWTARFDPQAFPDGFFADRPPLDMRAAEKYPDLARRSDMACLWKCFTEFPASSVPMALFSGTASPMAWRRITGRRVHYCPGLPDFLYSGRDAHLKSLPVFERPARAAFLWAFERAYAKALRAMDLVIAASQTAAHRLGEELQLDSVVLRPPVDTEGFGWTGQEGFFLCVAGAEGSQREELLVESFRATPEARLMAVSLESNLDDLRALAEGVPNVQVKGLVDMAGLRALAGSCLCAVHLPRGGDFEPGPVWAMASGKPVIGVAEGELPELAQDQKSGLFVRKNPGPEHVAEVLRAMTLERAHSMRRACEERAQRFGAAAFASRAMELLA